jgi:riboflavin kinase/FMN adenylyltransferase
VRAVLVGHDFCFGYKQSGNVCVLEELGAKFGFTVEEVKAVTLRGHVVSSTALRQLIEKGAIAQAARLLEQPFALEGEVVTGRGLGSKQTVPTLNLAVKTEVLPATGVYVTRTRDLEHGRVWPSISNVGYRPTFGDSPEISIETFLLSALVGETPRRIRVEFLWRVREERKFADPQALKQQILRDAGVAQAYFRRLRKWTSRSDFPVGSMA